MHSTNRRTIGGGWGEAAGLVLLTIFAFFPILFNGFVWDDDIHILWNDNLRTWGGIVTIWTNSFSMPQFYPVYHTLLWMGYRFWGLSPAGFHAMSLTLQCVNVFLLWRLLRRLEIKGAWFAAALFAVHPVLVETVGWAMEVKSVLSATFYFLALLTLLPLWDVAGLRSTSNADNRRRYGRGVLLFLLSLLSKSVTATMPAAILLIVWWKRGRITRQEIWRSVPLFLMGILAGGFTAVLERTRVGAEGRDWDFSFVERVLIASRAMWTYVGKLLWPVNLNFFYYRWPVDAADWRQYAWLMAAIAAVALLWGFRKRWGRGPLAAFLFFVGTLFPALGFSNVYPMRFSFVADHFQYLACIGIFSLAAAAGMAVLRKLRVIRLALAGIVLAALAGLTIQRCLVFRNGFTLYSDVVAKDGRIWAAQNLLANEYKVRDDYHAAAEHAAISVWDCQGQDRDCKEMLSMCLGELGQQELGAEAMRVSGDNAEQRAKLRDYLGRVFETLGDAVTAQRVRSEFE